MVRALPGDVRQSDNTGSLPPEALRLARDLGIDPATLASGPSAAGEKVVYLSTRPTTSTKWIYAREGLDPRAVSSTEPARPVDLRSAVLEPHRWTEQRRHQFWDRMIASGAVDRDEPYSFGKL